MSWFPLDQLKLCDPKDWEPKRGLKNAGHFLEENVKVAELLDKVPLFGTVYVFRATKNSLVTFIKKYNWKQGSTGTRIQLRQVADGEFQLTRVYKKGPRDAE